jgi:hypothetical protein
MLRARIATVPVCDTAADAGAASRGFRPVTAVTDSISIFKILS